MITKIKKKKRTGQGNKTSTFLETTVNVFLFFLLDFLRDGL